MVTVYTKPSCVQCNATYRRLDALGISYKFIDVSVDTQALDHIKELGYLSAPVVVPSFDKNVVDAAGERVVHWSGYRPDYIDQLKA